MRLRSGTDYDKRAEKKVYLGMIADIMHPGSINIITICLS